MLISDLLLATRKPGNRKVIIKKGEARFKVKAEDQRQLIRTLSARMER